MSWLLSGTWWEESLGNGTFPRTVVLTHSLEEIGSPHPSHVTASERGRRDPVSLDSEPTRQSHARLRNPRRRTNFLAHRFNGKSYRVT